MDNFRVTAWLVREDILSDEELVLRVGIMAREAVLLLVWLLLST